MGAVGVIALAMIVILSAFNGMEQLVKDSFNVFDPDLRVVPASGKFMEVSPETLEQLRNIEGVVVVAPVLEENALFVHGDQQHIGFIKGVDSSYLKLVPFQEILEDGTAMLEDSRSYYGILGRGVASQLGLNIYNPYGIITAYVPGRGKLNPLKPFREAYFLPSGLFEGNPDYSDKAVFLALKQAQDVIKAEGLITGLELDLKPGVSESEIRRKVDGLLTPEVLIQNKFEQHAITYRIMQGEKMLVFIIIGLVLLIAIFNIVALLTLLVVDKKKDIMVLWSLGSEFSRIRWIFVWQGVLISLVGAAGGILLGAILCLLQQYFAFVPLNGGNDPRPFPVQLQPLDFLLTIGLIFVLSLSVSWIRMRTLYFGQKEYYQLLK